MNNGWIKLHRKLLENPIASKPNYIALWVTLLLKANHKPNKFIWNGETQIINEGQILTGRKELALKTGIPEGSIDRLLNFLENEHQIEQQKTTKFRIITILKWSEYQTKDIKTNNRRTTNEQQANTNNNDNNAKETIATKVAGVPFKSNEFINKCCEDKQEHIRLIGNYMKIKKMNFPTKKTADAELRRNLKTATLLKDYPPERRKKALVEANKMTRQWTLETILKYLNK